MKQIIDYQICFSLSGSKSCYTAKDSSSNVSVEKVRSWQKNLWSGNRKIVTVCWGKDIYESM